ncbi:MAG: flagellar hook assembly protein FlgD [Gaiella sp.]
MIQQVTQQQTGTNGSGSSMGLPGLGKDDFLKLLSIQLRHQDPMNPVEDKEFIAQMAQFSSLEQVTNMADALERMSFAGQMSQSVGLIGKNVTWLRADESIGEGVVTSVSLGDDGTIELHVGDPEEIVAPADVRSVSEPEPEA